MVSISLEYALIWDYLVTYMSRTENYDRIGNIEMVDFFFSRKKSNVQRLTLIIKPKEKVFFCEILSE